MEGNKGIVFSRPPRFLPDIPRGEVDIPPPPSNQEKPEIQWLSILLPPVVMICASVVMAMFSGSMYVLITIATTVVTIFISLLNAVNQIKKYKTYIKTRKKKYLQLISDLRTELSLGKEQQIAAMNEINPAPSICLERLMQIDSKLWERTPAHRDFLAIRLGIGSIPSTLKPKYQKAQLIMEIDPLQEEPEKLGRDFEKIGNLPVCLDLFNSEISGIAGTEDSVRELLRTLAVQMITNHSYQDVKLILLLKEDELKEWDWIKQLPHVWDDDFRIRFMMCGSAIAHNTLNMLCDQLKEREARQNKSDHVAYSFSQYVFIVSDPMLLENEAISKYLYKGHKSIGVSTIFTADRKEFLPMNCKSVVTIQGKVGTYADKDSGEQLIFNVDYVAMDKLEKAARNLAPVRLKKSAANFTLPKSITLLETMKAKKVEDVDVMNNWMQNKTYNGMAVPIGARAGGELFNLDIQSYETSHGPHGLVAGTTGSGKSELLQSIIISLAINFHPHDVVFVLIDYKGGGMADVFKGMPHLVGTITNLGGNQTTRALVSIKSELKRRQALFSAHEVNNIDKYQKLYHSGKAKEALPHLIMIADEFAELKAEQPDFMKELVSAARVGRSLGVHLILATQKPAGVVDDQIWSNSRFKICLKVQDEADSKDVIKRPDAAMIKEPGRAYIQVGNDEIFEMFQSTFAGADYDPDGQVTKKKQNKKKLFKVSLDGRATQIYPLEQEHIDKSEKDSQLKAMVEHITYESLQAGIEPLKGPWLPPLQEILYLDDILKETKEQVTSKTELSIRQKDELIATIGIIDNPREQKQIPFDLNFSKEGHLLVYGSPGTGKTTLLETLILSVTFNYTPKAVHLYIMDFGGGVLKKFERLPLCGGVMGIEDEVKINQFVLFIFRIIEQRKLAFSEYMIANIDSYNEIAPEKLPKIMLIIDNYFALSEMFEEIDEKILTLAREGAKYGIYLIATATNPTLIRYKFSINFKMAITLQLTDKAEYSGIVGRTDGLEPDNILGRGLAKATHPVEFQTSMPQLQDKSTAEIIKEFASIPDISHALQIPEMPESIDIFKINKETESNTLVVGLKQDDLQPLGIDLKITPVITVGGDIQSGKSTLLESWVKVINAKMGEGNVQIYAYDSNNMGLYHMLNLPNAINLNQEDVSDIISEIQTALESRQEQLNECRKEGKNIDSVYASWKQIVIVIDNIIEFADNADYGVKDLLETLIKKAYGMKILILAGGLADEWANNWDTVPKALREVQNGAIFGSIKEQNLYSVRVPYGYYEKELTLGEGYFVCRNKFVGIKFAQSIEN